MSEIMLNYKIELHWTPPKLGNNCGFSKLLLKSVDLLLQYKFNVVV